MLLGSPEEVFATLASNPSIVPCLISLTSDYTVGETLMGDCPVSRPVIAAARALASRTGYVLPRARAPYHDAPLDTQ